mgnify:FL=1
MYKLFVALAMLATLSACKQQETKTLHLVCKTTPSETAPSVRPQYDVTVNLLADGATLTIDGQTYDLIQEYDAPVSFYRHDPWYNFQIGNRKYGKYALGIPTNENFARYITCEEVK